MTPTLCILYIRQTLHLQPIKNPDWWSPDTFQRLCFAATEPNDGRVMVVLVDPDDASDIVDSDSHDEDITQLNMK